MRNLLLAVVTVISVPVLAESWVVVGKAHPLWNRLNVKPEVIETGSAMKMQRKAIGRIVCIYAKEGKNFETNCEFPRDLKPAEVIPFYKALKVKPLNTSGAYTEIKIVDRLLVVGDEESNMKYNNSRLYLNHACRKVEDKKSADACMTFWATEILPSFEETNDIETVTANQLHKDQASLAIAWFQGAKYGKANIARVKDADYIGVMGEHQDEEHLYYFVLNKGENVVPQEVLDVNSADITLSDLGEAVKSVAKEDLDQWFKDIAEILFLGVNPKTYSHFWETSEEALRYHHEEAQEE